MTHTLDAITIEPKHTAQACVIWLHGLGATKHDFVSVVPLLQLPDNHNTRFIFPQAPTRPVTLNAGIAMPAWYDIYDIQLGAQEDHDGIISASQTIHALLDEQVQQGIPAKNIMLVGFSQGAALALHSGLHYSQPLAGLTVLSGYLPIPSTLPAANDIANGNTPILMMHGTNDPVLPIIFGEVSQQRLAEQGYNVTWKTYPMEHTVSIPQLKDISHWLQQRVCCDSVVET